MIRRVLFALAFSLTPLAVYCDVLGRLSVPLTSILDGERMVGGRNADIVITIHMFVLIAIVT